MIQYLTSKGVGLCVVGVFLALVLAGCGQEAASLELSSVLGIPAGNKEGTGLSGSFSALFKPTSDGCKEFPILDVPQNGITTLITIDIEQNAGTIIFSGLDGVTLRGGVDFDNTFEAGGIETIDTGGNEGNIVKSILLTGRFEEATQFSARGTERFFGRVDGSRVDCTITFRIQQGIRQ